MFAGHQVRKGWQDRLFAAFCRSPSAKTKCVLAVRYRHFKRITSKHVRTPFFVCVAQCRLPQCHRYKFIVDSKPGMMDCVVRCEVYGAPSDAHRKYHAHRYLKGQQRDEVASKVEEQGPYLTCQKMTTSAPAEQLKEGNRTEAPPSHVLRQAAYERRVAERYSQDWAEDLVCRMEDAQAADATSKVLKGSIHFIGKVPLIVHVYREHFIRRYHRHRTVLHIDATGSITKQIGSKRPFLYVIVAEGEGQGSTSYPLAHMLSESHTVPTLEHFLARLSRDFKEVTQQPLAPPRMVMDFSWALIHANVGSLLKTTVPAYLDACWKATKGDPSPSTIVSLCGAHVSHRFSRAVKENGISRESAPGFMWLFAKLQLSKTMTELDHWFNTFVMLALSKETPRNLAEGLGSLETPSDSATADETEPA